MAQIVQQANSCQTWFLSKILHQIFRPKTLHWFSPNFNSLSDKTQENVVCGEIYTASQKFTSVLRRIMTKMVKHYPHAFIYWVYWVIDLRSKDANSLPILIALSKSRPDQIFYVWIEVCRISLHVTSHDGSVPWLALNGLTRLQWWRFKIVTSWKLKGWKYILSNIFLG